MPHTTQLPVGQSLQTFIELACPASLLIGTRSSLHSLKILFIIHNMFLPILGLNNKYTSGTVLYLKNERQFISDHYWVVIDFLEWVSNILLALSLICGEACYKRTVTCDVTLSHFVSTLRELNFFIIFYRNYFDNILFNRGRGKWNSSSSELLHSVCIFV